MKRIISFLLVTVVSIMLFTACGTTAVSSSVAPSSQSKSDSTASTSPEEVTFEVWSEYPGDTAIL